MVDEWLPFKPNLYNYDSRDIPAGSAWMKLFRKSLLGVAVLSVSRQVKSEASDIIERKLDQLKSEPTRVFCPPITLLSPTVVEGVLEPIYKGILDEAKLLQSSEYCRSHPANPISQLMESFFTICILPLSGVWLRWKNRCT
jgi:hypothetical protein